MEGRGEARRSRAVSLAARARERSRTAEAAEGEAVTTCGPYERAQGVRWRASSHRYEVSFSVRGERFQRDVGRRYDRPTREGFEDAKRERRRLMREAKSGTLDAATRPTFARFAEGWLERRHDVRSVADDRVRLERHVIPVIGSKRLDAITTADMLDLLATLRTKKSARGEPLSKNSLRNIWANVVTVMKEARARGHCDRNPCDDVPESLRPRKARRHEVQRGYFSEAEVESLLSDPSVPTDRRTFYALMLLGGMRFGEAAGLTWADYNPDAKPLGHIRLTRQWNDQAGAYTGLKGKRNEPGPPRDVPVHPLLAELLEEWRTGARGFAFHVGRLPGLDDPIVPSRRARNRTLRHGLRKLRQDCERAGVTPRTQHECRNTFATLAQAHGAPEAWVRRITHNASGDVLAGYTGDHWPAMCRAVACLPIRRRRPAEVIALPRAAGDGPVAFPVAIEETEPKTPAVAGALWRGGRDSNPRPPA